MRTIKFDVEDSKVSGILQDLLNSGVTVKNVEVTDTQHPKTAMVSESCTAEDSGSSFTLYRHSYSISQNTCKGSTDVVSGVKLVGGTIFYIDDTAGGEYQFFDADGNIIKNIKVGDRPYYYRVIKKGFKDKYYVYHDKVYDNVRWTYWKDNDYVYEFLNTSNDRGLGKTNTETVMSKDNGAYITSDSNGIPTIWYKLQQVRNAKVGGCDDWFVPSRGEILILKDAIKLGDITGGNVAGSLYKESIFSNKYLWSSSEYSSQRAWWWHYCYQTWYQYHKSNINSVIFTRAF